MCPAAPAAGLIARLCNTLVVAASMAAVSESLAVGKRLGVDSKVLTQVREPEGEGVLLRLRVVLLRRWCSPCSRRCCCYPGRWCHAVAACFATRRCGGRGFVMEQTRLVHPARQTVCHA